MELGPQDIFFNSTITPPLSYACTVLPKLTFYKPFQITCFKLLYNIVCEALWSKMCTINTDRKTDRTKQWPYQKLDLLCTGKEKVSSNLHLNTLRNHHYKRLW
jgi:hypothetical protein